MKVTDKEPECFKEIGFDLLYAEYDTLMGWVQMIIL